MTWNSKPPFGTELDFSKYINRGLVLYYMFNEGSGQRLNDLSRNGNNGTLNNFEPFSTTSGWSGSSKGIELMFDGVNDFINGGNSNSLKKLTNTITISAWINPRSISGVGAIAAKSDGSSGATNGFILNRNGASVQSFAGNGIVSDSVSVSGIKANSWNHTVSVITPTQLNVYLNGVAGIPTTTVSNPTGDPLHNLAIGKYSYVNGVYFNGSIREVMLWNRALNAQEIQQLYLQPYAAFR